jgi:dCTP diphosphatase
MHSKQKENHLIMKSYSTEDKILNLSTLEQQLKQFTREREWEQFHTPKNLAMALSVEAAELLELFQWDKEGQAIDEKKLNRVGEELSDILVYLLRLTHVLNIDLPQALEQKMLQNAKKYPAEMVKGQSKKYDQY